MPTMTAPAPTVVSAPLVLVVEDEPKIAALLADVLRASGFAVSLLDRGDGVLAWVRAHTPAAVLLDRMLPGLDGVEVCRQLRRESSVPILMITARVSEVDRLLGLDLGADDYICKPFSPREVIARLRAVLRRSGEGGTGSEGTPALLQVDRSRFEARVRGHLLELTAVEFRLLDTLCAHPGRVYSRQHLIDAAYVDHRIVSDRTIDSHIRNLRRKLADQGVTAITSVYGVGFRFDPV